MKKLMQLLESGEKTAFVKTAKGEEMTIDYKNPQDLKHMGDNSDIKAIKTASGDYQKGTFTEGESPYEYSKTDSAALGQEVVRTLIATLKAQGDEIHKTPEGKPDVKLSAGTNRFSVEVNYGDNVLAKNDTFKFTIDPKAGKLLFKLGNKDLPLVNIAVTDGNNDALNTVLLQKNLGLVLKKLKTEPNVTIPGDEPVVEPQPLDGEVAETTKHVGGKYVNYPKHGGDRLGTFSSKKAAQKQLAAIEISKHQKNEEIDEDATTVAAAAATLAANALTSAGHSGGGAELSPWAVLSVLVTLSSPLIGMAMANASNPIRRIKSWWDKHKLDKNLNRIVTQLRNDPEVIEFIKEKKPGIQAFLKTKLDEKDQQYVKKLNWKTVTKGEIDEKLDPVGKEDDDINNDGKVDSTDKYLGKRRQAISKNIGEDLDVGHEDNEPSMLQGDVYQIAKNAAELYKALEAFEGQGEVDFPHWWQAKIIRAADDLQCAKEYLEFETKEPAIDAAINTLGEAKGICCHDCGHVHVRGSSCPTPKLTGKKNCKFRD